MDLIVKKASALTSDEKAALGLTGIPADWPIESFPYVDTVPDGFMQMTDTDLDALKANNQAAYDAWVASITHYVTIPNNVTVVSQPPTTVDSSPPFNAKTVSISGVTKKLYKRVTGIQTAVTTGVQDAYYTIPFAWCKITGLQVVGSEGLDKASFWVLDSTAGNYSGYPNYPLNQFGFAVNICKDFYEYHSEFDADLYQNMQVRIQYTSVSDKTVGFNFILNEVKS